MKKKNRPFSAYQQSLFNKYEIDESYLQTYKQRRACLELLEKIDKNQGIDEPKMIGKIASAFHGSELYKKIASCMTIASLLVTLQSTPAMALAASSFQPAASITNTYEMPGSNSIIMDADSFLDITKAPVQQTFKNPSLHLVASKVLKNEYQPMADKGVTIDGDSDVTYYPKQEVRTLTVIDTFLEDWQTIQDAVREGEILLLDGDEDPLDTILAKLEDMKEIDCLNIISHGASGKLKFENGTIDSETLEKNKEKWEKISQHLSQDRDIQLFGCNVAKGKEGKAFIDKLAQITGADVAASINPTGAAKKGGDWVLEAHVGDVAGNLPFTKQAIAQFLYLLLPVGEIPYNLSDFTVNGNNVDNNYFSVSAATVKSDIGDSPVAMAKDTESAFVAVPYTNTNFKIIVDIKNVTDLASFELEDIYLGLDSYSTDHNYGAENVQIIGYKVGGGTILSGYTDIIGHDTGVSSDFANWGLFNEQQINRLVISAYTGIGFYGTYALKFKSFKVSNMMPPAPVNQAPILDGTFTTDGTVDDNSTTNPFSGVTVSDNDGDDVSVNITFTGANGTLSSPTGGMTENASGDYTLNSDTAANVTSKLQALVFTPTENQVAPGNTKVTTFTLTPNDGTTDGTSNSTTQVTATSINDAPSITSGDVVNFAENGTGTVYTAEGADPDTGDALTWSISGADAAKFNIDSSTGALRFLSAPDFETPADVGGDNIYNLTITATDNGTGSLTASKDLVVTVTNVNDAPSITSGTAVNFAEDGTGTVYTAEGTDQDNDSITWSISGTDAAQFNIDSSTGVLTFLSAPDYDTPADADGNNIYNLTITATDNGTGSLTTSKDLAVTVTNVNDAPSITSGAAVNFAENGTGTVYTAEGTDPDTGDTLTWSISGADSDKFSINSSTGVLTFLSAPDYETPADDGVDNVYNLTITATDNGTGTLTASKALAVTVTNVNDAPSITSGAAVNFAEDGTGTVYTAIGSDQDNDSITWSISGTDAAQFSINSSTGVLTFLSAPDYDTPADDGVDNVYNLTITATDNGTGSLTTSKALAVTVTNVNDAPSITSGAAVNFAENGTGTVYTAEGTDPDTGDTLTWSISGTDAAKFNIDSSTGALRFLSAPDFETPADDGVDNVYNLTITATDNGTGSLTASKDLAVTVTNVNDAPSITSGAAVNFAEDGTGTVYTAIGSDQDKDSITWSISGPDAAKFSINSSTGVLTFLSAPDYETPADDGGNNVYNLTITATDNGTGSLTTTKDLAVTVTNVNDAPSITSGDAANFAENGTGTVYTAEGTDPDTGDTLTWIISGVDAAKFSIDSSTGVLTFLSAPDYETPADDGVDNVYNLTITATDNGTGSLTASKALTVAVTDVNDAPSITSGAAVNFVEDGTGTVYTAEGTDQDNDSITWSISGTDAAKFNIDSSTGALTFLSAPDYETPADGGVDNIYNLTITATDNGTGSLTTTKDLAVTVTNVNDAPSITSGDAVDFAENGTGTVYTAEGTDPDTGDTLTWSISGTDAAKFSINSSTGVLTFLSAPDYETPADGGGDHVYDLTITATDNGTGNLTASKALAVSVTNVNDAPSITSGDAVNFAEDGTGTVYTAIGSDQDKDSITWSISGTDAAKFNINSSTGVLTFLSAPDYETPADDGVDNVYNLTITATDNGTGSLTASKALAVTVTNVNDAPSITSGDTVDFAENGTGTVYTAEGTDPDTSDTLTWSISGTDAAKFSIDSSTGVLTFLSAPDYETPADGGGDHVYNLTITATDNGTGSLTASKALAVSVTNVNDAPSITSGDAVNFAEDGTGPVYTAEGTDQDNDSITWSISGTDAAKFSIDSSTGVLTFLSAPDYEKPADGGGNNVYNLTITATDTGSLTVSKTLAVTVTNVNDVSTAADHTFTTSEDTAITNGDLTAYATDVDTGDTLTYAKASDPTKGTVTVNPNGTFTYTPAANFNGTDSFTWKVSDGTADSNIATATINVSAVNDIPNVTNSTENGTEDTTVNLTATDFSDQYSDVETSPLSSIQIVTLPDAAQGVLQLNGLAITAGDEIAAVDLGNITFVPAANFNGNASFTWKASDDGTSYSASAATMTLAIADVADVPGISTNIVAAASDGKATVTFIAPVDNGGSPITKYIVTSNPGGITAEGTASPITITGLTNGTAYTFKVKAVNAIGEGLESAVSNEITPQRANHGGGSSSENNNSSGTLPNSSQSGIDILVNGNTETAATGTMTQNGDQTIMTVTVDGSKIEQKLEAEGNNAVVTIPVNNNSDVVVGQLNGQTVKNMETKEAVLEIRTNNVTYTLPASQINIENVSNQIGRQVELKDITVNVTVSEPPQDTVKVIENTADKNNYQIVVQPVQFDITCTSSGRTVEVSKFNAYVERMVAIPEGVDPNKITTGVILNSDGTFSHVPTQITIVNGKYYAKINSLTNSTYSVIWSPKTFKDVETHWAKQAVNDMGSRLVISGTGNETFAPERDITRAEFAAILVRGLGLMRPGTGKPIFNDVPESAWYYDAVCIAYENGLISGMGNDTFKPMEQITREQAMAMVERAMKITGLNAGHLDENTILEAFKDSAQSSEWARESIASCITTGIIQGKNGQLLAPKDQITRAEVAVIIQKLLQKSKLI